MELIGFTYVMLKLCVQLAALSRPVGKSADLVRLELTIMPFAGIYSTTELPVHIDK